MIQQENEPLLDTVVEVKPERPCWKKFLYQFFRCLFFGVTVGLESWFFYSFCIDNSKFMIDNNINTKKSVIAQKTVVAFFWFMSILCLFRLFFFNPGFVDAYIKSEELETIGNTSKYAIYSKEDHKKKINAME